MPTRERSLLDSRLLSGVLVLVVLAVVGAIFVPGILGPAGPGSAVGPSPTPVPTAAQPTPVPTFARPTPSPQPTFTIHVVRSGDTLSSIAKKYRTSVSSIAWWNRGTYPSLDPESGSYQPNRLEVGWTLKLLPDTIVDKANPPTPSPSPR
jgi:Tfp pilus assembly protein FimV